MQRVNKLSKILLLTVNRQFPIYLSALVFSLFLVSCQKDIQFIKLTDSLVSQDAKGSVNLSNIRNIVTKEYVSKWLKQEAAINKEARKKIIGLAIDNLEKNELTFEAISRHRFLAILPIKNDGKTTSRDSVTVIENFILFVDSFGVIQDGYMSKYYPDDQSITELPQNAISDIFAKQTISIDGTFNLTNIDDIKQYEFDFVEGLKKEFRLWQSRFAPPPGGINNGEVCIDWYLTTTIFGNNGEVIDYSETYLFTNCTSPAPGNSNVPVTLVAIPSFQDVDFTVVEDKFTNSSKNEVISFYKLSGQKIWGDVRQNIFTNATKYGTMLFHTGLSGVSTNSNFMTWTESSNDIILGDFSAAVFMPGPTTATATVTGVKAYPNGGGPNGGGLAPVSKSFTWHASSIL